MVADKTSQLEHRHMDAMPRPTDYGRKITNFLEAQHTGTKQYMKEGLRRIAEMWMKAHDALKDIHYEDGQKEAVYNQEFAKIWAMGFMHFKENIMAGVMEDADKDLAAGTFAAKDYEFLVQTKIVIDELQTEGMSMKDVQTGFKYIKDPRYDHDED